MHYILIPHVKIKNMRALSTSWLITPAQMIAYNLFVHNLGLKIGMPLKRCAFIHHDYHLRAEKTNKYGDVCLSQYKGQTFFDKDDVASGSNVTPSLQPDAFADMELSFIIECDDIPDLDKVEEFMYNNPRVAGGQVDRHGRIEVVDEEQLESKFNKLNGFLIKDSSSLLNEPTPVEEDSQHRQMHRLLYHTSMKENSWVLPAMIGYMPISKKEARPGTREGKEHMFVEGLVGLVQYISFPKHSEDIGDCFWSFTQRDGYFVCQTEEV